MKCLQLSSSNISSRQIHFRQQRLPGLVLDFLCTIYYNVVLTSGTGCAGPLGRGLDCEVYTSKRW